MRITQFMGYATIDDVVHRSYKGRPNYTEIFPGVPKDFKKIKTIRDLLEVNYKHISIEDQIRNNLIAKIKNGENPYPGIIGYDDDVIPAINRAILSGHDILFVGQIGQAKTS